MHQILQMAAFWVIVVVVIRVAVCFPGSVLARVLFSRIGPMRARGEAEFAYLSRWARFGMSCSLQAAFLFAGGWAALRWDASLSDSLAFMVLWAAVVPLLGAGALLTALLAFARSILARRP